MELAYRILFKQTEKDSYFQNQSQLKYYGVKKFSETTGIYSG